MEKPENGLFSDAERIELGLDTEDGRPTELGRMLSEECRHAIKVSVYGSGGRGEPVESKVITGALNGQIDAVMEMLSGGDARRVRETLAAVLVQRDYAYPAELLVNVFPDRVEFVGMGALADTDGFERWRNEGLLAALRRMRYTVSRPEEFTGTRGAFLVVLRFGVPAGQRLVEYLEANGSLSRKKAEEVLGLRQTAAGKVLKELCEQGIIETVGAGKNTKYILVRNNAHIVG